MLQWGTGQDSHLHLRKPTKVGITVFRYTTGPSPRIKTNKIEAPDCRATD
jgi:hypothetical protein